MTKSLREAAEQDARYARELQAAQHRIAQKEGWRSLGVFLYGVVSFFGAAAFWSLLLPENLPGWWPWVGWFVLLSTWIGLLGLRKAVVHRFKEWRQCKQTTKVEEEEESPR
jgi:fatty acid desaturase